MVKRVKLVMGLGDCRNQLAWSASLLLSASACFVLRGKALVSLLGAGQICTTPVLRLPQTHIPTLSRAVTVRLKPVRESGTRHALIFFFFFFLV